MPLVSFVIGSVQSLARTRPKLYGIVGCLGITATYVGLLYVWRKVPRNHPSAIKKRLISVAGACSISWLPIALKEGHLIIYRQLGLSLSGLPGEDCCSLTHYMLGEEMTPG
jgi:hypothetical protein